MSKIVTFEQAKRITGIGFVLKWTTFLYEIATGDIHNAYDPLIQCQSSSLFIKAPSVSEALDWVREYKGIHCSVSFVFKYNDITDNVDAQYFGQVLQTFPQFIDQVTEEFDTHHLASSALLDAVLTYLEQKEKK